MFDRDLNRFFNFFLEIFTVYGLFMVVLLATSNVFLHIFIRYLKEQPGTLIMVRDKDW